MKISLFDKKNVYLIGANNSSTFITGNNTNATIYASGPAFVQINNLRIKNGNPGIDSAYSNINFTDTIVENNSSGIIMHSNSRLDFRGGQLNPTLKMALL
jgi:hypothetical protein